MSVHTDSISLYQDYSPMNQKLTGLPIQLCIYNNSSSTSYTIYACPRRLI